MYIKYFTLYQRYLIGLLNFPIISGKAQLQTGYYGSEAGKGRNGEVLGNTDEKFDPAKESILGDSWKKAGNYDNGASDGGVAGQGYSTNEKAGDLAGT